MLGAYFCIGASKHNVVVVIGMGSCIHGCLFYVCVPIISILPYSTTVHSQNNVQVSLRSSQLVLPCFLFFGLRLV